MFHILYFFFLYLMSGMSKYQDLIRIHTKKQYKIGDIFIPFGLRNKILVLKVGT